MKHQTYLPLLCLWLLSASTLFSAPIQNLKFTDVVKEVKILNVATKAETTAKVGDVLVPPNVIKTGADSRAELVAEDQTVTRVGANTIFSVEANSRDVNIAKGSVLFHSPAGKGGGNIKSAGATASVLGTTLIVGANQSGGFKVMLLEGKGQVTGAGGGGSKLTAGQMSFAMPGQAPSQPLNFELKGQVSGSKLVGGFSKPLASIAKIEAAVNAQQSKIASGEMASTGLMIGDSPSVAFKVDSAVVRVTAETVQKAKDAVVRARVAQAKTEAAKIERSRQILDPRFLAAVSKSLALTTNTTPPTHEQPIPLTLEKFDATKPSTTGNFTIGDDSGWGAPIGIPGNREEKNADPSGDLTLLLANNVTFNISPSTAEAPATFAIAPFYPGKNYNGLVALQEINFTKSVDFVERMVENQGDPIDPPVPVENFFLSAGKTITAEAGTIIKSSHAVNFDIYAGGTGFAATNDRTGFLAPISGAPVPLTLSDTMVWNALNWTQQPDEAKPDGSLSIEAPGMNFTNLTISAGRTSGASIDLNSTGPIVLSVDAAKLDLVKSYDTATEESAKASIATAARAQNIPLPLGFSGPEALAIQAFNVRIASTGKPITISGVPIFTNNLKVSTGAVPVVATEQEARIFTPDAGAAGYVNKLYLPVTRYDSDQDGTISASELSAIPIVAGTTPISGTGVPPGTTISSFTTNGGMLELTLSGSIALTGVTSQGTIGAVAGTFTTGTVTVGATSANQPEGKISIANVVLKSVAGDIDPDNQVLAVEATGDLELTGSNLSVARMIDLKSKQTALLKNTTFSDIKELSVWAEQDITFEGVTVEAAGEPRATSKLSVTSNSKSIYLNTGKTPTGVVDPTVQPASITKTMVKATAVSFTADNGDIVINSHHFRAVDASSSFTARAKNTIGVYDTVIDHSKVSIAANTVVLKDVQFDGNSLVNLRSKEGKVSGNPGYRTSVVAGNVNILSNVKHGDYTIAIRNDAETLNSMNHLSSSAFNALLPADKQAKISIGAR